ISLMHSSLIPYSATMQSNTLSLHDALPISLGWNNTLFPNASMPNPFWQQQGLQRAVFGEADATGEAPVEHLEIATPGAQTAAEFDQTVRDLTTFLEYAGEPAARKRQSIGVGVPLILSPRPLRAGLRKKDYWRAVH